MTIHRSKQRIDKTGEVFTPASLVNEMLDTLPTSTFTDPSTTFLDPAAGDGNFLIEILKRKLLYTDNPLQALRTIYGVELMPDNVQEARRRLKEIAVAALSTPHPKVLKAIDKILDHNIVCADSLSFDYENWKPL